MGRRFIKRLHCYNTERSLSFLKRYYSRINSLEKVTKEIASDYQKYLQSYKSRQGEPFSSKT